MDTSLKAPTKGTRSSATREHPREQPGAGRAARAAKVRSLEPSPSGKRCGGHGEPLVLLHPFALCTEVWRPILPALKRHHEVYALAIPGHHGSDPLPPDYRYSISDAVDVLERKLDALGIDRAHMVGNSLGGWLALELARRGRALSAVALAPGGGWEHNSWEHRRLMLRFRLTRKLLAMGGSIATRLTAFQLGRACLLRDAVANPGRLTAAQARLLIERTWSCAAFDEIMKAMPTQRPVAPFASMPCPVRLVWGAEDRLLPIRGYSERWRRMLPQAEFMVLPQVGHVPMYDDPEAVAASILGLTTAMHEDQQRLAS